MPDRLKLALYCPGCMPGYHLPYFAAEAAGIYARHGLEVEIHDPERGPDNVHAVARGDFDACLTSVAYLLRAKAEDPEVAARFVFMVARRSHMAAFAIEGRPAAHGRPIQRFADLAGASVLGSASDGFGREYASLLRELELEPGEMLGLPYARWMRGLAEGRADVAVDFLELLPRFERAAAREDRRVRALPFHEAGVHEYGSGLVVSNALIDAQPDLVARLVGSVREALVLTREDPAAAFEAMRERFPGIDRERTIRGWRIGEPAIFADGEPLGAMNDALWRATIERNAVVHGTPLVDPETVYEPSFAAGELAPAA